MMALRPVRSSGRAFLIGNSHDGALPQGSHRSRWVGFVIVVYLFLSAVPLCAQHDMHHQSAAYQEVMPGHEHHAFIGDRAGWEGSVAGIAYSEFNHHLTGMLVLIIGLSELRHALAMSSWAWTRFLLPGALLTAGSFLLIWSAAKIAMDHAIMGTMAVMAGSSKLLSDWFRSLSHAGFSKWELPWAVLILLIGIQLLIYSG